MDFLMGIGIALPVVSTTAIGTVTGVAQGVAEQRRQNEDSSNQSRMLKFHLDVHLDARTSRSKSPAAKLANRIVTLHDDKLWLEPQDHSTGQPADDKAHPFTNDMIRVCARRKCLQQDRVSEAVELPPPSHPNIQSSIS